MINSTIVTAFYKIPSKASFDKYLKWIKNFLNFIKSPIIFFTTEDLVDIFKSIRNENIKYEILEFKELNGIKQYGLDFWKYHTSINTQKCQTTELGIIWYEKKEFVLKAIEKNYYNTNNFIWCDAGCVRSDSYKNKITNFGQNISKFKDNSKINIQLIRELKDKKFYIYPDICIAGAIISGYKEAWINFKKHYDIIVNEYTSNKITVIDDQYIMASIVETYPEVVNCVRKNRNNYIDEWFFFLEEL
jgi:hypothetical protein